VSLETAVAAPFRDAATERLGESEFVVAVSLERDWFSPEQAKRLLDIADGRGLVDRTDDGVVATLDIDAVEVPEGFTPDESLLQEQSTFERVLDLLVADGADKQAAVAAVNERQRELDITLEAAAIIHARKRGIDVTEAAASVRSELRAD
jgi:hypothetical protein